MNEPDGKPSGFFVCLAGRYFTRRHGQQSCESDLLSLTELFYFGSLRKVVICIVE